MLVSNQLLYTLVPFLLKDKTNISKFKLDNPEIN